MLHSGCATQARAPARPGPDDVGLVAVTGASGPLGRRVASRLADHGVRQRLIVRDADRAPLLPGAEIRQATPDGTRREMTQALRGVAILFYLPTGPEQDRPTVHRAIVGAAVAAGVSHLVYLSLVGAGVESPSLPGQAHFAAERLIRAGGLTHTILRSNLQLDQLAAMVDPDGGLRAPAARGLIAAVSRDDVADVAVSVLGRPQAHSGRVYEVTGREAISLPEAAERMAAASGLPIRFEYESAADCLARDTAPASMARTGAYAAIAAGRFAAVTDTVRRLTGRNAQTLEEHLRIHPDELAHVRPD